MAFANIEKAAKYYDVDLSETSWRELGVHLQRGRKAAAAKGLATKRKRGGLKAAGAAIVNASALSACSLRLGAGFALGQPKLSVSAGAVWAADCVGQGGG